MIQDLSNTIEQIIIQSSWFNIRNVYLNFAKFLNNKNCCSKLDSQIPAPDKYLTSRRLPSAACPLLRFQLNYIPPQETFCVERLMLLPTRIFSSARREEFIEQIRKHFLEFSLLFAFARIYISSFYIFWVSEMTNVGDIWSAPLRTKTSLIKINVRCVENTKTLQDSIMIKI